MLCGSGAVSCSSSLLIRRHQRARCQAEIPLTALSEFVEPPLFKKKFGPRGVIHSFAGGKIEDTGPLTKKRMETVDEEVTAAPLRFMENAHKEDKPFMVWWNSTRMHIFTHLKPGSEGRTGLGIYADGMVEHDAMVGQLLAKLKDLASRTTRSSCIRP